MIGACAESYRAPSSFLPSTVEPIVNILHWCGTFVTTDEPILTQYY